MKPFVVLNSGPLSELPATDFCTSASMHLILYLFVIFIISMNCFITCFELFHYKIRLKLYGRVFGGEILRLSHRALTSCNASNEISLFLIGTS